MRYAGRAICVAVSLHSEVPVGSASSVTLLHRSEESGCISMSLKEQSSTNLQNRNLENQCLPRTISPMFPDACLTKEAAHRSRRLVVMCASARINRRCSIALGSAVTMMCPCYAWHDSFPPCPNIAALGFRCS